MADALQRQQSSLKGQFTTMENDLKKQGGQKVSMVKFGAIEKKLEGCRMKMESIHHDIYPLLTDPADQVIQDGEYELLYNRYLQLLEDLEVLKPVVPIATPTPNTSAVANSLKLPKFEIPKFNGDITTWNSFYDLFVASVHNHTGYSNAQKLSFLKSSLGPEAVRLISNLQVTDANYAEALKLLQDRYDNKREIVNSHLKRLFSAPVLKDENAPNLRKLIDTVRESIQGLRVLKEPVGTWDSILVFLISEKLDAETRRQWVLSLTCKTVPKFDDFIAFLDRRERALSESGSVKPKSFPPVEKKVSAHVGAVNPSPTKCYICPESHMTFRCPMLLSKPSSERRSIVQKKNLCFNCLKPNHRTASCPSTHTCKKCNAKHHTLVHADEAKKEVTTEESHSTAVVSTATSLSTSTTYELHTILPTAIVNITDSRGCSQPVRALIDSGSEVSFVSTACVKRLGLPTKPAKLTITGVAATNAGSSDASASLVITSRVYDYSTTIEAYVLHRVANRLPSRPVATGDLHHLQGLQLADPFYYKPEEIDILLGSDVYASLLRPTPVIIGPSGTPSAFDTALGWVVSGPSRKYNKLTPSTYASLHVHCQLESIVRKFWEIESVPYSAPSTPEEQQCEQHFLDTHSRLPSGRYCVSIPFKSPTTVIGLSRDTAIRRLLQVERRLASKIHLKVQYVDFMHEYAELGHMERVPVNESKHYPVYYMPHHCVLKESSTTTKLRVVFDGSCKSASGKSLNEIMMVGPKTQDCLVAHLLRFRMCAIGITCDAKQMYRQFVVATADRDMQRIVWRNSPSEPIEDWKLTTVTYGTASAPYLATRALIQLAKDEKDNFPLASEVTLRDSYVDDIMSGTDSIVDAVELQTQLLAMFSAGGIELRKWASNSSDLMENTPAHLRESNVPYSFDSDAVVKTLGLQWNPTSDTFSFSVSMPTSRLKDTKRSYLSDISKTFDPLGWLSPITIKAKCVFQSLWLVDIQWDDVLPEPQQLEWNRFRLELPTIQSISIPRHVLLPQHNRIELLGFCDASIRAYAAAVYIKSTDGSGTKIHLLTAKTRVAPTKGETLPRLELCGALLLTEIMNAVRKFMVKAIDNIVMWTDSTIVLHWLASPASRWNCYVSNRIAEIQGSYPREFWHHVRSQDNPADVASRGIYPSELKDHPLWWNGPTWLLNEDYNFNSEPSAVVENPDLEAKKTATVLLSTPADDFDLLIRYSSLSKLQRVTAYLLRFVRNWRGERLRGHLSVSELRYAMKALIQCVQSSSFKEEIAYCNLSEEEKTKKPFPKSSKVVRLSPFICQGLLRVGGRLRNSKLSSDMKFPILLPKESPLTRLIIGEAHIHNLHAGPLLLHATLRQRYWIVGGRGLVQHHVHNCLRCFRQRASTAQQRMADLPSSRVVQAFPFQKVGVDFCGPFTFKRVIGGRSNQTAKCYVAVFVCFVTLAYHLEVVSDLSTTAFLASLRRFVSRRGFCSDIYSDNGRNFVGADKELKRFWVLLRSLDSENETVHRFLSTHNVTWHFNPPAAPHHGGLWESGVRAVKGHLKRVIGTTSLNFEEIATLLAQVEACLNSRPLSPLSSDPEDLSVLTPGHFLLGRPVNAILEPDVTDINTGRLSRWQHLQQMLQHFWRRWHSEYLTQLQHRYKWTESTANIKVGMLVIMKDDLLPPTYWKLARVTETHPGPDGLVRVVTILTDTGSFRRPIVKLCPLPPELNINHNESSSSPLPPSTSTEEQEDVGSISSLCASVPKYV